MPWQRGYIFPGCIIPTACRHDYRRRGLVVRASPPCEQEVMGSINGHDRPKSLKLVVVDFPRGAQDYGNSTTTSPSASG